MNMKLRLPLAAAGVLSAATLYWLLIGHRQEVVPLSDARAPGPTGSQASTTQGEARFLELRALLPTLAPEEASRRIQTLLDSGIDAPTGLSFKLEREGLLSESPTLRLYLLDYLARVDRVAAGDYAKKILAEMNAPEEWAVCLRNYARAFPGPEGAAFLTDKMRQLLNRAPWQTDPTAGYLEAFDVAVYLGGTELLGDLSQLVQRRNNPALAHAAYLSLDRLTLQDPAPVLDRLQRERALLAGREESRANFIARASMLDPRQRETVEGYLLDPERGPAELHTFAGLFPNANFMLSNNLLTRNDPPSRDMLVRRDRETLNTVEAWLRDERFQKTRPELERIRSRLVDFLDNGGR